MRYENFVLSQIKNNCSVSIQNLKVNLIFPNGCERNSLRLKCKTLKYYFQIFNSIMFIYFVVI